MNKVIKRLEQLRKSKTQVYIFGFKNNDPKRKRLNIQDKRHFRVVGALKLEQDGEIKTVLRCDFTEEFLFDTENNMAYYVIKIIPNRKERKVENYADA